MFKNTATKVALFAFDTTTGAAKTGDAANITAYVSKDYGATTVLADTSATEQDATNAKGWYLFDVAQAESNADALLFTAKSTTANVSIVGQYIFTTPNRFTTMVIDAAGLVDANAVKLGPTGSGTAQTARDLGASVLQDMTQVLPTTPVANTVGEALFLADILGGRFGTAQAGAASTITLDAGASAVDGRYVGYGVFLYGGTGGGVRGVGQERTIVAYNGTTKVATVAQAWGTNPDNTSKFMLIVQPFANVGMWNGTVVATPATAGIPDVNAKNVGGTAQSAVDIAARIGAPAGASVSADVAAVKVDTAAVKVQTDKLAFTVANQVDSNVIDWKGATAPAMTGDAFARLGAPAGASVSADVAATKALLPTALVGGRMDSSLGAVAAGVDFSATMKTALNAATPASVVGAVGSVTGLTASDVGAIKAKTDNLPSDPADASDIAGAFSTVNSTLGTIAGYIDTEVAAIKVKTDNLPADPADASDIAAAFVTMASAIAALPQDKNGYRLSSTGVNDLLRTAMTEGYAADGAAFTLEQAMFMVWSLLAERNLTGTTLQAKKLDGSTNSMAFTLDSGTTPTTQTRSA